MHPYIYTTDSTLTQIQLKLNETRTVTLLAEMLLVKINTAVHQKMNTAFLKMQYKNLYTQTYTHLKHKLSHNEVTWK